jgi:ABC-type glycerol-3-phosphate transport system substrate-binding protein
MRRSIIPLTLAFVWLLSACSLFSSGDETVEVIALTPTATAVVTPVPEGTPDANIPITNTETTQNLTIWVPPEIANRTETAALLFEEQIRQFQLSHPDVVMRSEQKLVAGQGGILSYLRSGHNVAPAILPDLVALPTNVLAAAVAEELIYPLDALLETAMIDDLYPAAWSLVRVEGEAVAYPFALTNLTHLLYTPETITATLPLVWGDLVATNQETLIFPANGNVGALLLLQFYLEYGGTLTNEAGQPHLEIEPLTNALAQFDLAQESGLIVPSSSNLATPEEVWQLYQSGSGSLALVTANLYLTQYSADFAVEYAPVPGLNGPLPSMVEGWAWAISTSDPTRQALALELLKSLVSDVNLGEWSYGSRTLPARRSAFSAWPADDVYGRFVQQELEQAAALPTEANATLINILRDALFNVISLATSPQLAAEAAAATLQQ